MTDISTWMRSFVTVADTGSFSGAGLWLGARQSTISKHIAALEAHLNSRLLHRTTRSLTLTDEGAAFYESALAALAAIDEAEASVGLVGEARGIVRITVPLSLAESRVIAMISRFLMRNPHIQVDLRLSDHALNLVADNLDLAIRVGQLNESRLIARRIGTTRRVAVASPAYLDRVGRPQRPADLASFNCIAYSLLSTGPSWSFDNGDTVSVSGNFRADSPNALRAAALAGVGIALNAAWLFERELANGSLEAVLPGFAPQPMPIHIVLPSGRHIAARTRALVEFMTQEFAADPLLSLGS